MGNGEIRKRSRIRNRVNEWTRDTRTRTASKAEDPDCSSKQSSGSSSDSESESEDDSSSGSFSSESESDDETSRSSYSPEFESKHDDHELHEMGMRESSEPRSAGVAKYSVKSEPSSRHASENLVTEWTRGYSRDREAQAKTEKISTHYRHHAKSTRDSHGSGGGSGDDRGPGHREHRSRPSRDAAPRQDRAESTCADSPGGAGFPDGDDPGSSSEEDESSSSFGSDSDSDTDDEEEKLHNQEIDEKRKGVFLITRDTIRKAKKNKPSRNMPCEARNFARGSEIDIIEWIVEMEVYFVVSHQKPDSYVGLMLQKIASRYFKEVVVYKDMDYLGFRNKLIEVFEVPDIATSRLLKDAEQQRNESIRDFMNRLRLLVLRAHPNLCNKERERILVSSFILGLRDQELAISLTMASVSSSAEAERRATEGESAKRTVRQTKSFSNCISKQAEVPIESAEGSRTCRGFDNYGNDT